MYRQSSTYAFSGYAVSDNVFFLKVPKKKLEEVAFWKVQNFSPLGTKVQWEVERTDLQLLDKTTNWGGWQQN